MKLLQRRRILSCVVVVLSATRLALAKRAGSLPKQFTKLPPRGNIANGMNHKQQHAAAATTSQLHQDGAATTPLRGGGAIKNKPLYTPSRVPIELNPNYEPPPPRRHGRFFSSPLAANPVAASAFKSKEQQQQQQVSPLPTAVETTTTLPYNTPSSSSVATTTGTSAAECYRAGWSSSSSSSSTGYDHNHSWWQGWKGQFLATARTSPSLMATTVACVAVFLAWQVAPRAVVLRDFFVCRRANMNMRHWPSLVLAAVSHADPWHLVVNLVTLWSLGPAVQRALQQQQRQAGQGRLGPLMGGAAVASSLMFLLLQKQSQSQGALGLSGVTLALLAVYARLYPSAILGLRVAGIIPVRVRAERLLLCLTAWSAVGAISTTTSTTSSTLRRSNNTIGHAAHLGGLLFGMAYHYLVLRQPKEQVWYYPATAAV